MRGNPNGFFPRIRLVHPQKISNTLKISLLMINVLIILLFLSLVNQCFAQYCKKRVIVCVNIINLLCCFFNRFLISYIIEVICA